MKYRIRQQGSVIEIHQANEGPFHSLEDVADRIRALAKQTHIERVVLIRIDGCRVNVDIGASQLEYEALEGCASHKPPMVEKRIEASSHQPAEPVPSSMPLITSAGPTLSLPAKLAIFAAAAAFCVWLNFGTISPCGILKQQAARQLAIRTSAGIRTGDEWAKLGYGLGYTLGQKIFNQTIDTLSPIECSRSLWAIWVEHKNIFDQG